MGAGIGKMICPQSIAIGAAAASLVGREGVVLRKMFLWFALDILLASAVVLIFAG
jgi:lactate permease